MSSMLEFQNICKYFPGVKALDNISFKAYAGEVLAFLGENGAGKSTLLKVLNGDYQPTSGKYLLDGVEKHFQSPHQAIEEGISVIYQERQILLELSVAENIYLGRMPVNRSGNAKNVSALFGRRSGRDQGSAASGRLHHQRSAAPAAHDAVAHGKSGAGRGQVHRELGDYRSMPVRNALRQISVFPRIQFVESCSDNGDGAPLRVHGPGMGFRVHAARQSGNDGDSGFRQVMGDVSGAKPAVMGGHP